MYYFNELFTEAEMKKFDATVNMIDQEVKYGKKYNADADTVLANVYDVIPEEYDETVVLEYYIELNEIVATLIRNGYYEYSEYSSSNVSIEEIENEVKRRGIPFFGYCETKDSSEYYKCYYLSIDEDSLCDYSNEADCEKAVLLVDDKLDGMINKYNEDNDTEITIGDVERLWDIYKMDMKIQDGSLIDMFSMSKAELDILNGFQILYGNENVATEDGLKQATLIFEYLYSDIKGFMVSFDEYIGGVDNFVDVYDIMFERAIDYIWNGWGF
jgi:hypothetical protein